MYKIYCDLDGVLSDFDTQFLKKSGASPDKFSSNYTNAEFWKFIEKYGESFWSDMPWMKNGKKLWLYIKDFNVAILSAPSRDYLSRTGKIKWVKNNLGDDVKLILINANEKYKYANDKSILIDDREKNIESWRSAGGIGYLYTDSNINDIIEKIDNLINK